MASCCRVGARQGPLKWSDPAWISEVRKLSTWNFRTAGWPVRAWDTSSAPPFNSSGLLFRTPSAQFGILIQVHSLTGALWPGDSAPFITMHLNFPSVARWKLCDTHSVLQLLIVLVLNKACQHTFYEQYCYLSKVPLGALHTSVLLCAHNYECPSEDVEGLFLGFCVTFCFSPFTYVAVEFSCRFWRILLSIFLIICSKMCWT